MASPASPTSLERIEPHSGLLKQPPGTQRLYKVMKVEDLAKSVSDQYLHFKRVDTYTDFRGADVRDGIQLPQDRPGNEASKFEKVPSFSAADLYDRSRARTYACCFSLEDSLYIWENYGNGGSRGKVCLIFEFDKLRKTLNHDFSAMKLEYGGIEFASFFSINYGLADYVDSEKHRANENNLPNPITYAFLKDRRYEKEQELRVCLSAEAIWAGYSVGGNPIQFPPSMQLPFDFSAAITNGTILEIRRSRDADMAFLETALRKRGIELA